MYKQSYDFLKFLKTFPVGTIVFFQLNIKFKFSHPKRHILGWKRVVWRIDRWDTSSRFVFAGADTPRPTPIEFGVRVAPRNLINVFNFCNKIFRGLRSTGGQIPRFPIDFAGHR